MSGADQAARELEDDRRIARLRQALNTAVAGTCNGEPGMTFGDVVDALTGVAHRYAARALADAAAGDLVIVAADVPAGLFDVGTEVIVAGDAGEQTAAGYVIAVHPAQPVDQAGAEPVAVPPAELPAGLGDAVVSDPAASEPWWLSGEAPPEGSMPQTRGLCGRCGSPEHRTTKCDADDFTAAAWLGR